MALFSRSDKEQPYLLALVSDIHGGSTVALMPEAVCTDDGQWIYPTKAQLWIAQCWQDYWKLVAKRRRELNAKLYTVFNGDVYEGDHHRTSQLLTRNPNTWEEVIDSILKTPLSLKPDKMFFVRGTSAHVGEAARKEEALAKKLGAEPDPEVGRHSWYHLKMILYGWLLDFAHRGRMGQRAWTQESHLRIYANDIYVTHLKEGRDPPHLVARAHYHTQLDSGKVETSRTCPTRVITTGAWQLHTAHAHEVVPDKVADIGGWIITVVPAGIECESVEFKSKLKESPIWTPEG